MKTSLIRRALGGLVLALVLAACTSETATRPPTRAAPSSLPGTSVAMPTASVSGASAPVGSLPSSSAASTTPSPTPVAPGLTPVAGTADSLGQRIMSTIRANTSSVALDLSTDVEPWGVQLDGTVDDGRGPGRLFIVASSPGATGDNLCQDPDFRQGGPCRRIQLPGGDVRFERGLVDTNGVRTVVVSIRRLDGSGVLLEAGNFRFDPPAVIVGGEPRPTPEITRSDPLFSVDQLAALADALSAATRDCSTGTCP